MNVISRKIEEIANRHVFIFFNFFMGSVSAIAFSFLATVLLNSYLSKEEMGYYSYVFTLLSFCYPILSLSLFNGYARFINVYENDSLIIFVKVISWLSTIGLVAVIRIYFDTWFYVTFAFVIIYQEELLLARAKIQIFKYNFLNIFQKLSFLLLLLLYYFYYHNLTAREALFFMGISYFLSYIITLFWKKKSNASLNQYIEFDKKNFLKFCFFTMLTTIVNWILVFSNQIVIKYYFGYEALAPYAVANRIIMTLSVIAGIFLVYYPTAYFKDITEKKYKEVFLLRKYFFYILLITCFGLFYFKNIIYTLFGASEYLSDNDCFFPLLLGEVCRLIASVLMTFLTFNLRQTTILLSLLFISFLNIALNILLVPMWGTIASAYCTFACLLIYVIIAYIVSYIPERKYVQTMVLNN